MAAYMGMILVMFLQLLMGMLIQMLVLEIPLLGKTRVQLIPFHCCWK